MKKAVRLTSACITLVLLMNAVCGATVLASEAPYIKSDTSQTINLDFDQTYTFKFTVVGTATGTPTFSTGDKDALSCTVKSHTKNDYYVTVEVEGYADGGVGVYSKLPGQSAQRQAIVNVPELMPATKTAAFGFYNGDFGSLSGQLTNSGAIIKDGVYLAGSGNQPKKVYIDNLMGHSRSFEILAFDDDFSGVPVTVTSSNPSSMEILQNSALTTTPKEKSLGLSFSWLLDYSNAPQLLQVRATNVGVSTVTVTAKSKSGKVQSFVLEFISSSSFGPTDGYLT